MDAKRDEVGGHAIKQMLLHLLLQDIKCWMLVRFGSAMKVLWAVSPALHPAAHDGEDSASPAALTLQYLSMFPLPQTRCKG